MFDRLDDEQRLLKIGSGLASVGERYLDQHPRFGEWLVEAGYTQREALLAFEQWLAAQRAWEGWKPAKNKKA